MKSDRAQRVCRLFWFFFLLVFLAGACTHRKISNEKPPPPPVTRVEKKGVYHTVERHQTLFRICKTYGVGIQDVAGENGISDVNRIRAGQRLFIPGAERVMKVEIYIEDVVRELPEREKTSLPKSDFIWPVEGRCISGFEEEERKRHQGIDISSPAGVPIKASNGGWVIYSGNMIRGYGNLIILHHSDEFVTVYAHNQVNLVEEGMRVEKGQTIGKVGQTGRASGPHLHFEIRKNNKAVDPFLFLK